MTITVVPYCVKPSNAFTPNGDGINEKWSLTDGFSCIQRIKAQVYNRYGSKVFESNDYKNNWDGTREGKPLPDGTYYWVVTYTLINGKLITMKGNVTILR
jgi:gliding motility-associated-like protein